MAPTAPSLFTSGPLGYANLLLSNGPMALSAQLSASASDMGQLGSLALATAAMGLIQKDLATDSSTTREFDSSLSDLFLQFKPHEPDIAALTGSMASAAKELARIESVNTGAYVRASKWAMDKMRPLIAVNGRPEPGDIQGILGQGLITGARVFVGSDAFKEAVSILRSAAVACAQQAGEALSPEQISAIRYIRQELGERAVDGHIEGNNEIARIVEAYVLSPEHTDLKDILLKGGDRAKKTMQILTEISNIASHSLLELLATDVEDARRLKASKAEYQPYADKLKDRSSFFPPDEVELNSDPKKYWATEAAWVTERKTKDPRWSPFQSDGITPKTEEQEREDTRSLLDYSTNTLEPKLRDIVDEIVLKAGLSGSVLTSVRTKGLDSSIDKVGRLRKQEWAKGQPLSIVDLVDLSGARIVVDDLQSLEKVMLTIEDILKGGGFDERFQGMRILRKENKFVAGELTLDPYRAIHYIMTFAGKDGEQFSFELQLKTFDTMVSSDLSHNTSYKPGLSLSKQLHSTVFGYNWKNDINEAVRYLGVGVEQPSLEAKINTAIERRDWNALYDLVLSKIDYSRNSPTFKDKAEWIRTYDIVNAMLKREIEFLTSIGKTRPDFLMDLTKASHNIGYYYTKDVAGKDGKSGEIFDFTKHKWLVPELSEDARRLLTENGRKFYDGRYENFKGSNQKLTIGQLELHLLSLDDLRAFFKAAGKDPDALKVKGLIERVNSLYGKPQGELGEGEAKAILKTPVINLYHQSFEDMIVKGASIVDPGASKAWNEAIIGNQLKAVALTVLLTEIGGTDEAGVSRDLGRRVAPHIPFTWREKLTHEVWEFAIQYDGEYAFDGLGRNGEKDPEGWRNKDGQGRASMSYEEFVTSPDENGGLKFGEQINFDREIDVAILRTLTMIHLRSIADRIVDNRTNPVRVAMLQRVKAEIIAKYIKSVIPDHMLAEEVAKAFDGILQDDSDFLLHGGRPERETLKRVVGEAIRAQDQQGQNGKKLKDVMLSAGSSAGYSAVIELLLPVLDLGGFSEHDAGKFAEQIGNVMRLDLHKELDKDIARLRSMIPVNVPEEAAKRINSAILLANELHSGEQRSGADLRPYLVHSIEVAENLISYGRVFEVFSDDVELACDAICAAVLHDVRENIGKGATGQVLRGQSGTEQASYVDGLLERNMSARIMEMVRTLSRPLASVELDSPEKIEAAYMNALLEASTGTQMVKVSDWYTNFSDMIKYPRGSREDCEWTAEYTRWRLDHILRFVRESRVPDQFKKALLQHILEEGRRNNELHKTIRGAEDVESLTEGQQKQIIECMER